MFPKQRLRIPAILALALTAVLFAGVPASAATPRSAQPLGAWEHFVSGVLAWLWGDTSSQSDPSGRAEVSSDNGSQIDPSGRAAIVPGSGPAVTSSDNGSQIDPNGGR
jgi:hypothetical protein